jgi:putative ABC transport system permease protein
MLATSGGLLLRSLVALLDVDPGFRPQGVIAMRVDPASRIRMPVRLPFFTSVLEQVSKLPGIEAAALTINLPMDRNMGWDAVIPGRPDPALDSAFGRIVSPRYFETVGIRMIAGRDFDARDQRGALQVAAINLTLARRLAPAAGDAIGSTLVVNGTPRRVVAVVGDVKHQTLDAASGREVYIPLSQAPSFFQAYDLVVRGSDPIALVPAIRDAIWRVDRQQAIGTPVALQALIDRTLLTRRVLTSTVDAFAAVALLLAALGTYGVAGYRVAQRTKELAIRVAVGAPRWRVVSVVTSDTLRFVGVGLLAGLPLAIAAGVALRRYLFGVQTHDVTMLVGACAVVLASTLIAVWPAARRAVRVDAASALRVD